MIKYFVILICTLQLVLVSCNAQVPGCPDPLANNYHPSATLNDGSCIYNPISVSPVDTEELSESLTETSGLILWDGYVWSHNDNGDTKLYGLDTTTADILLEYSLEEVVNTDWEEISQDEDFIYIGDFGNNSSGNRTDLHLLRIEKSSLIEDNPVIDTIWFSYSDQYDLNPVDANQTDFDCEAFIVSEDSLFLFTKQWTSTQTSVYSLPKIPGSYTAFKRSTYNIQGLITGSTYLGSKKLLVLCGYTSLLHPFFYLLYDFKGYDFFSGNKRRVTVSLPYHQVEGITTSNGLKYYVSNEKFELKPIANSPQKLHRFNLRSLLEQYLVSASSISKKMDFENDFMIYPNPATEKLHVALNSNLIGSAYSIIDETGKETVSGRLTNQTNIIDLHNLRAGLYLFTLIKNEGGSFKFVKH